MSKKSKLRRALRRELMQIPEPEPVKQPTPKSGSACWKCMKCNWFQRRLCAGLIKYWGPHCPKAKRTVARAEWKE